MTVADAEDEAEGNSEFLLLAQALDRIRSVLGKAFFHRISMVSGDVNFVDAAMAGVGEGQGISVPSTRLNPLNKHETSPKHFMGQEHSVMLFPTFWPQVAQTMRPPRAVAARSPLSERRYRSHRAFPALISVERYSTAARLLRGFKPRRTSSSDESRASSLMRIIKPHGGGSPPIVRRSLSRQFWAVMSILG